ncbi:hypothetical protein SUDANB15_00158 [Streptomyces sp. enrichment culture]
MTATPVVLAAIPLTGHVRPILNLARHLVSRTSGARLVVEAAST